MVGIKNGESSSREWVGAITWPVVTAELVSSLLLLGFLALGAWMLKDIGTLGWIPIGLACLELLRNGRGITVIHEEVRPDSSPSGQRAER